MAISKQGPNKLVDEISATAQTTVGHGDNFKRFQFSCVATSGAWTITVEDSGDSGTTFYEVSDTLSLASGDSGTIYLGPAAFTDNLRLNMTRTGGTLSVWETASDAHPLRY